MSNINQQMKSESKDVAFLIAGGYHTDNLMQKLKSEGYSYLVLTPKIDYETDHGQYETILMENINNDTMRQVGARLSIRLKPLLMDAAKLEKVPESKVQEYLALQEIEGSRLSDDKSINFFTGARLSTDKSRDDGVSAARLSRLDSIVQMTIEIERLFSGLKKEMETLTGGHKSDNHANYNSIIERLDIVQVTLIDILQESKTVDDLSDDEIGRELLLERRIGDNKIMDEFNEIKDAVNAYIDEYVNSYSDDFAILYDGEEKKTDIGRKIESVLARFSAIGQYLKEWLSTVEDGDGAVDAELNFHMKLSVEMRGELLNGNLAVLSELKDLIVNELADKDKRDLEEDAMNILIPQLDPPEEFANNLYAAEQARKIRKAQYHMIVDILSSDVNPSVYRMILDGFQLRLKALGYGNQEENDVAGVKSAVNDKEKDRIMAYKKNFFRLIDKSMKSNKKLRLYIQKAYPWKSFANELMMFYRLTQPVNRWIHSVKIYWDVFLFVVFAKEKQSKIFYDIDIIPHGNWIIEKIVYTVVRVKNVFTRAHKQIKYAIFLDYNPVDDETKVRHAFEIKALNIDSHNPTSDFEGLDYVGYLYPPIPLWNAAARRNHFIESLKVSTDWVTLYSKDGTEVLGAQDRWHKPFVTGKAKTEEGVIKENEKKTALWQGQK